MNAPQRKAAPPAKDTAANTKEHSYASTDGDKFQPQAGKLLTNSDRWLTRAEEAGRQLIRSWCDYKPREANTIHPSTFPGILSEVAERVLAAFATGAEDFAGVYAHCTDARHAIIDELCECNQGNAPFPKDCGPLIEIIRRYDHERRRDILAGKLKTALERGDDTKEIMHQFAALEAESSLQSGKGLRERAYELKFDPNETPPPDEMCMVIGDVPIGSRGNLTVQQGKSKVGKTAVTSAILGAALRGEYQAQGDTLCIEWRGDSTGSIIHMDTEQSRADWHALIRRGIIRSGMPQVPSRLVSLPLVCFSRSERLTILRETLAHEKPLRGKIDLVLIDGVADLCTAPNDEAEALELVSQLHALAQEFDCPIFCVLHENPGSESGKTRGHLGSELNRKAFANLRIDKDSTTQISTIYGTDMRKREIPREQGFCFAWDEVAGMHTFQGRAAGLKAAQRDEKAAAKAREFFGEIFDNGDFIGKTVLFPTLTVADAVAIYSEIIGNGKSMKPATMKKRMQKAELLGVLRKASRCDWGFIQAGTSGNNRERDETSH